MIAAALIVLACTVQNLEPNDLVTNEPVCSANGRFCAVVRWNPGVADFTSERAGKVFGLDQPEPVETAAEPVVDAEPVGPPKPLIAALYEMTPGGRRLVAETPIERAGASQIVVPDSGRTLVALNLSGGGGCGGRLQEEDPFITIYRLDGSRIGALKAGDVLTWNDIFALFMGPRIEHALRHETATRELLVLSLGGQERRIDLANGALLDEKRDIFPAPHTWVTPAGVDSQPFFARAVRGPLPQYPIVAVKARISGQAIVDLFVSEAGDVVSAQVVKPLPFGLSEAALEAARAWKFRPSPAPFHVQLDFHFQTVDEMTWRQHLREQPPQD
jgi:TonB family protein